VSGYYGGYALVGLLTLAGVALVTVAYSLNRLVRPHRSTAAGRTSYECGLDPVGEGWAQTQVRYYVFAFLYVVFAVESVFLFPWAVIFARPGFGTGALVEMGVFLLVLAVALLYAWRKRVLTWV
jgi:NADH-quinone oxidoreductase subunit A